MNSEGHSMQSTLQKRIEEIKISIKLSSTHWGKLPKYKVFLDNQEIQTGEVDSDGILIEFHSPVTFGDHHELKIDFINKQLGDTKVDSDGNIMNDMILNIEQIMFNDVDIGILKWTGSVFKLQSPIVHNGERKTEFLECVNLGMNGSWILKFYSPIYLWLIEHM